MGDFVIPPGKNRMLDAAWKGHLAESKKEAKAAPSSPRIVEAKQALAEAEAAARKKLPAKKKARKVKAK